MARAQTSAPVVQASTAAQPQSQPKAAQPSSSFDPAVAEQALSVLRNQASNTTSDAVLAGLAAKAAAIETSANQAVAARAAALQRLQGAQKAYQTRRRLSAAEQRQQDILKAQAAPLTAQLAQARSVANDATQTFQSIAENRRKGFSGRVLEQTAGPLSPDFWQSLPQTAADLDQLDAVVERMATKAATAPEPQSTVYLLLGVLAGTLVAWPLRRWLLRLVRRGSGVSQGRVSAVGPACMVVVNVGLTAAVVQIVRVAVQWAGFSDPVADQLIGAAGAAVIWAVAVVSLGRAVATDADPQRRLVQVSAREATRAGSALWTIAAVTAAGSVVQTVLYVAGASVASTIVANCVVALAYAGAAAFVLFAFASEESQQDPAPRRPTWTLIALALASAITATVMAVLLGYTTLAALIAGQMFWLSLVAALTYVILRLIDQMIGALFSAQSRIAGEASRLFGLSLSTVLQIGVLVGAVLQLSTVLIAVLLVLTPFGQSGELVLGHLQSLVGAFHIGKATLSPLGITAGLATFAVGIALAHGLRAWFSRRYLPLTNWDAGLRNSATTGVAYLGVALALICGLMVTGVSLTQIALITSALSVGVGFGLQQVVQNFVAGIILLIERPIKVGDWVNIGGVEGDVLDIRVRATSIRAFDCSTVIVPNANLITLNLQNKTPRLAHTRVQLQVTVAKAADADRVRAILLDIADKHRKVLKQPAPRVTIDGFVTGGGVSFSCWFQLDDPRCASEVRSDLYFEMLAQFQAQQIGLL